MKRVCAVTGASGYVGSACAAWLRAAGFEVLRLVRRPDSPDARGFRLGAPVSPETLEGASALVHCAYDFGVRGLQDIRRVNVEGTRLLLEAARAAGIGKAVLVSSISAFEGCASLYGRAKLEAEALARAAGASVLRPGLVYGGGDGAMFGALKRLCGLPLLPVFDGGTQPLFLAHVDDVCRALQEALSWSPSSTPGPVIAAHPEPVLFAELLRELARRRGRRLRTFSVPGAAALAALRAAEALRLPIRFRSDSLLSLLKPDPSPDFSETGRLGLKFRRFLN